MEDSNTEAAEAIEDNKIESTENSCSGCQDLRETILKMINEKTDLEDRYLRKHADFENYRKRMTKEKHDAIQYANTQLMRPLLDVLDNLERAKASSCTEVFNLETLKQGLDLISQTLYGALSSHGLLRIQALGTDFDPERHQAISSIEDASVQQTIVVEEYQPGYILFDRVLRPSMVRVAVPVSEEKIENWSNSELESIVQQSSNGSV